MVTTLLLVLGLLIPFLAGGLVSASHSDDTPAVTVTVEGGYGGVPARVIHHKLVAMRHLAYQRKLYAHRLHKTLLARPSVAEAINLACVVYGNCSTLWRKARCESKLNVYARNNSSGDSPRDIFQFKPSTFRSTPFARFSIWSPYAAALAAGWMHVNGRGGEWSCR